MRTFNDAAKDILKYKVSEIVLYDTGSWYFVGFWDVGEEFSSWEDFVVVYNQYNGMYYWYHESGDHHNSMVIKNIDHFNYGDVIDVREFARKLHLPIDTRKQILKDIERFDDELNEQKEKQLKILKNLLFNKNNFFH